jgi:hypothetical protein
VGKGVRERCIAFLLGFLLLPSAAWASAWTLPEGTGQWVATLTAGSAADYFENGAFAATARYNKAELQLLIEYGVTDRLTVLADPGLQHVDIAAPTSAERSGLGYAEFGARYAFLQNQTWVLSGQATLRIPGTADAANPAAIGYTEVESDLRLLLGRSFDFEGKPAFFDLEAAERVRTAGAPSEFRLDATFGVQVLPRWLLLAQSFNVVSEGSGISLYGGSYDYEKLQVSAVYSLTPTWSLQGGAYTTYAGQNALQENGLILSVWHKF